MFFWVNFHGVAKLAMIQTGLWQEDWTKFGYKLNMKVIFFKTPYFFNVLGYSLLEPCKEI
jgi:hypothetical protein